MKYYTVMNRFKKSVDETEWLVGEVDGVEVRVSYTTNWRSATFRVGVPDTEEDIKAFLEYYGYETLEECFEDYDTDNIYDIVMPDEEEDFIEVDDFYEWELDSTWDSCCEDYEIFTDDEEVEEKVRDVLEEEGLWGLFDELGFESDDCIYEIHNGIVIEEEKEPEE
jgi:hypothetical protein